jgi:two-component system sensor histidine kinase YesM
MLISCYSSSLTGWNIIEYRAMASLLPETSYFRVFFILFVALLTVFVAVLSLLISSRISRPIVKLSELMRSVEGGDLGVSIAVEGKNEIRHLAESFNSMVSQLRELIARIYEQEKAKKKAEFEALQAQINPHFLYNTLGNIQWMAIIHKLPSIADMTSSLIRLLKLSLASPNPMIELEKEVDMLVQYVHILNVRYNNSIEFVHTTAEGLASALVPRLILQPLVENAIIHGMEKSRDRGRIELDCAREAGDLVLRLRDSGSGMSEEKIAGLFETETAPGGRRRIGLCNVQERIRLYYGGNYGIAVASAHGEGTTITLRMPIRNSSGEG